MCPTLCNPTDCSPPGSSAHGDSPGKNIGVGCRALLQEIFSTQGSKLGLLHHRQILYCLSHQQSKETSRECLFTGLVIALPAAFCPYAASMDPQHSSQSDCLKSTLSMSLLCGVSLGVSEQTRGRQDFTPLRLYIHSAFSTKSPISLSFSHPFLVIPVSSKFLSSSRRICFF